jgi:hypothetical protein
MVPMAWKTVQSVNAAMMLRQTQRRLVMAIRTLTLMRMLIAAAGMVKLLGIWLQPAIRLQTLGSALCATSRLLAPNGWHAPRRCAHLCVVVERVRVLLLLVGKVRCKRVDAR